MEIKVGDKVLLKKESNLSDLDEWLGKVVTVKTILKKDPLVFEFEEGEDIKTGELVFFRLFGNELRFKKEPTKSNWVRIIDVEKVIEPKEKSTKKDVEAEPTDKQKVYVVMAKGVSPSNVIEYHLVGVCSTREKAEELEYAFNNSGSSWLKTFIETNYID